MKKAGEKMSDVGKKLSIGVTAPIVGLGTVATKAAVDFESAFAGVRKTVDATEEEFAQLEQGIRDMSKRMPTAATDIAAVAEAAGQLGIETDNILKFTEVMIGLGEATNLTAEEGATQFARFANIVGMSQQDFDRLGSAVVALGNNFATTEAEIVEMGMRLAGQGAQIGMTEAQIMALATAMSSVGIEAEAGGTAMSTTLKKMQTAVSLANEDLDKFAKAARMSAEEFAAAFSADPAAALQAFVDGLTASSAEGENLTLILSDLGITGIRESDTLLRLAGANDVLRGALETATEAWEENTALQNEVAQRYATTESQLSMLKNSLTDLGIQIGEIIVPVLMQMVEAVRPVVDWFANLDDGTKKVILTVAGLAAAIGPLLIALGMIVSSIGALMPVMVALIGPVGLVVAAIAGLVAGLTVLYNKNEDVRRALNAAWEWLQSVAEAIFGGLQAFWKQWGNTIIGVFRDIFDIVKTIFERVFSVIKQIAETVFNNLKAFWDQWGDAITTLFKGVWNSIKIAIETAISVISNIVKLFLSALKGDWQGAWDAIKGIVTSVWDGIKKTFANVGDTMVQVGKDIIQGLINGIKNMASAAVQAAKDVANRVADSVKGFFGINSPSRLMVGYGENIGEGLAIGIHDSINAVRREAAALAEAANIKASGSYGSSGGVGSIIVNVTGNTITSPADEDRLAEKISRKIAQNFGMSTGGAW
jgi:TP901 family phage tail tape measure protein